MIVFKSDKFFSRRNVFKNGDNILSKMINHFFFKKLKILYSSDYTILFKSHQYVAQIPIK